MIKESYNLNSRNSLQSATNGGAGPARLSDLMLFTGPGEMNSSLLAAHLKLPSIWIIDWNLFYEIDECEINFAERINTILPLALRQLQPAVRNDPTKLANSLPALDLFRGRRLGLPSGQDVARKIGTSPLTASEISNLIRSKRIDGESETFQKNLQERVIKAFSERTPLWFYVLAEAETAGDGRLGHVGSRIVAETILMLLYSSEYSILVEKWETGDDFLLGPDHAFDMPRMLRFIRESGHKHFAQLYPNSVDEFDELNPLGDSELKSNKNSKKKGDKEYANCTEN
jgi:hypothetical protein